MTNNKLSPVKVFIPVNAKEDDPENGKKVFVLTDGYGGNVVAEYRGMEYFDPNLLSEREDGGEKLPTNITEFVTHFLQEQERYIFNREELEWLLKDAFEQFRYRPFPHNEPTFEQYIQSLF